MTDSPTEQQIDRVSVLLCTTPSFAKSFIRYVSKAVPEAEVDDIVEAISSLPNPIRRVPGKVAAQLNKQLQAQGLLDAAREVGRSQTQDRRGIEHRSTSRTPSRPEVQEPDENTGDWLESGGDAAPTELHRWIEETFERTRQEGDAYRRDFLYKRHDPPSPGDEQVENRDLSPELSDAIKGLGIERFYSHQMEAYEALRSGRNVVLCTPTASGKTFAYNPAVFQELLEDRRKTALYVFPLNALGVDQENKLRDINERLAKRRQLTIGIYNSAVPEDEARKCKEEQYNQILVTTPDSLHRTFLRNNYPNWRWFFRGLSIVVLDEAHMYKGAFGSNVANIVRRLRVKCRAQGASRDPRFVVCSATIANPIDLAVSLTGLDAKSFQLIQESGAPKPARHYLTLQTAVAEMCRRLADVRIQTSQGLRRAKTIVFCRSIRNVEYKGGLLRRKFEADGRPEDARRVRTYCSGSQSPRELLQEMSEIDFLFSTTALMAGVDIGDLDICIVDGFPGLLMDARQMFGRAGRRNEGANIFVGRATNLVDRHYLMRPEQLFFGDPERAVVNPRNLYLLGAHLRCAAHVGKKDWDVEGPLRRDALGVFDDAAARLVDVLARKQALSVSSRGIIHEGEQIHKEHPVKSIRGITEDTFVIHDEKEEKLLQRNELYAYRDYHPEAIFQHQGQLYQVARMDLESRRIEARPIEDGKIRTQGYIELGIEALGTALRRVVKPYGILHLDELRIEQTAETFIKYRILPCRICRPPCDYRTPHVKRKTCPKCSRRLRLHEEYDVIDEYNIQDEHGNEIVLGLSKPLETVGCWYTPHRSLEKHFMENYFPQQASYVAGEEQRQQDYLVGLSTIVDAVINVLPERLLCDQSDIDGLLLGTMGEVAGPHLVIYDAFPAGLGIAEALYEQWSDLLKAALEKLENCTCVDDRGCPICVVRSGRHSWGAATSKLAARFVLRTMLGKDVSCVLKRASS